MEDVDVDDNPGEFGVVEVLANGPRKLDCRLVALLNVALVLVFAPGTA